MTQADHIRKYLKEHPGAKATEVVNALHKHGVTKQRVYGIMHYDGRKARGKTVRPSKPKQTRTDTEIKIMEDECVKELLRTKLFVRESGGINRVRQVLDLMEQLEIQ